MKKVISLMLIMFFLCSLCLPIAAASRTVDDEVIIPEEEKNVAPICAALAQELPFLITVIKENKETNESRIIVSLPEMTEDMKAVCERLLNAYWSNCNNKIDLLNTKTIPEIIGAGGTKADERGDITASVFSGGSVAVMVGVVGFAVGFLVAMLIFKRSNKVFYNRMNAL